MGKKKDYDYFEYFSKSADYICQAADYLHETLTHFDKNHFEERMNEMHKIENMADNLKHEMAKQLIHEFLPPIEREDILALAHELDDVIDALDDVMRRIYMFNVDSIHPGAIEFSNLIKKSSTELKAATVEFRNFKNLKSIKEHVVAVNTLESEGDNLHSKCFRQLFSSDTDTRSLIIWTTIYEDLENCLDNCEDAVDIIESVIMKNS